MIRVSREPYQPSEEWQRLSARWALREVALPPDAQSARKAGTREAVAEVQRQLLAAGYKPGPADGVWGPGTEVAFRDHVRTLRPLLVEMFNGKCCYCDRSAVDPPEVLLGPGSKGQEELDAWRDYYEKRDGGEEAEEPSGFSAYKDKKVRAALEAVFAGKCAYCESRVLATSHGDIEHWRPKKSVRRADGTRTDRGYWWRAADWNNLLLSCTLCNQPPGKGIRFPVADEERRALAPGQEDLEKPLLIDPTVDHPEKHLTVIPGGEERAVLQAVGEDPKGLASLDVFRLNRTELVTERRERLARITSCIRDVRRVLRRLDGLPAGPNTSDMETSLEELEEKLAELKAMLQPDQKFLMLTRRVIEPFLEEIGAA